MVSRMISTGALILTGVCLLALASASAQNRQIERIARSDASGTNPSERRTALVIGNADYKTAPLRNPTNDAKSMSKALRELGFDVMEKENLSQNDMKRAIGDFGQKIRGGGVGLFYYSGHGMQVNGNNYIIPVDAKIQAEQDVEYESVNVGSVLAKMEAAENRVNIVILDACRDNPYKRSFRSAAQGLAFMNAPSGTIVAYSTAPGSVASDGSGSNGLYTGELIKNIQTPGLRIEDVFKRVRSTLQDVTQKKQVPWESVSLVGDFYFKPPAASAADAYAPYPTQPLRPAQPAPPAQVAGGQVIIEKPAPELPKNGSLRVKTKPTGAGVYLDDELKGTSPLSLSRLTPGVVKIRVFLEGYEISEKTVEIQAKKEVQANFLLDRETTVSKPVQQMQPGRPAPSKMAAPVPTHTPGEVWQESYTGMEFVWVPGGCFQMGCGTWTGYCYSRDTATREVCVDGFWMGKYEVTQDQWKKVMGSNPSYFSKQEGKCPVEQVSWKDVKDFIRKLSLVSGGQNELRLPTEAEWEYSCRSAGKEEEYAGGIKTVDSVVWSRDNSRRATHPVGAKVANGLGLYDMGGNVWEWVEDEYTSEPLKDLQRNNPVRSGDGSSRVLRGGAYDYHPCYSNCAYRLNYGRESKTSDVGFRLIKKP